MAVSTIKVLCHRCDKRPREMYKTQLGAYCKYCANEVRREREARKRNAIHPALYNYLHKFKGEVYVKPE